MQSRGAHGGLAMVAGGERSNIMSARYGEPQRSHFVEFGVRWRPNLRWAQRRRRRIR